MHAVGLHFRHAGNALENAASFKVDGMYGCAIGRFLLVHFCRNALLRFNILNQCAAHRNIEHLNATANTENRHVACNRHGDNQKLEDIALRIIFATSWKLLFSVSRRQNVAPASQQKTIQMINHRFSRRFVLDFRQQDGNTARAQNGLHVILTDKHLSIRDIVRTGNANNRMIHGRSPFLFSSLFFLSLSFFPKDSL